MRRFPRFSRTALLAMGLGVVLAFPLAAVASHRFSDVPTSNLFHDDITALADSGVTTGCASGKFCPATTSRGIRWRPS